MNDDGAQHHTRTLTENGGRRPEPTDEQKRHAMQFVRVFWLLVVAMLLSSSMVLPWKLVPLTLGVAAVVVGIIALVKLVRRRMRPALSVLVSIGLAITVITTLGLAAMTALWDRTMTYESCMGSALTLEAVDSCESEYLSFELP